MTDSLAQLEIIKSAGKQQFSIQHETVTIGRDPNSGLVLQDPTISVNHARIDRDGRGYSITDLSSLNGTRLNNTQLDPNMPHPLRNGDLIHIGAFTLCFQSSQSREEPALTSTEISQDSISVMRVITDEWFQDFALDQEVLLIGSHPSCDIYIEDADVAVCHARLSQLPNSNYLITNLDTRYGLRYLGVTINEKELHESDNIRLTPLITLSYRGQQKPETFVPGKTWLNREAATQMNLNSYEPETVVVMDSGFLHSQTEVSAAPTNLSLSGLSTIKIGRDPRNDLVIGHPTVSRFHAKVERSQGSFVLSDLESNNGTYVNGKRITAPTVLRTGDTIRIGCDRLVLNIDETLTQHVEEGNLRIDACNLCKVVGNGTQILQEVSLSILPREFVAILGPSGSGKSTLLDALNGLRPATSGSVRVNGVDLYKNFSAYFTQLGYVPQKNIIHEELTVAQTLDFAAQLRMPSDTSIKERRERIQEVLTELALTHRQDVPIKLLSGGQQRRVCIGVELLTKPSLFFLDEATSGLDPGTEADMMNLLRQLADQGRTILIITHATQNIRDCDLVIYMAEGGRLAYFGPPNRMLDYFRENFKEQFKGIKLQDFSGIYRALDREKNPHAPSAELLQQTYLQSELYQEYVVLRQVHLADTDGNRATQSRTSKAWKGPEGHNSTAAWWRQFVILSARNLAILTQDRANLLLILAIAPLLGLLDFITWKRSVFSPVNGNAAQSMTMLFVTSLVAVMIGAMTTNRELIKEVEVYRRERMIGLRLVPYILSKVWIAVLLAAYQGVAFLIVKKLAVDIPGGWDILLQMYVTLTLGIIGGMILGLLVSAIAPSQNMAPLLIIMVLIPMIIFSGGIQPASAFGAFGQGLNYISVIKWPFESLVTLSGLGRDVSQDPCWQKTAAEREKLTDADKAKCQCYDTRVFKSCNFPGIKAKYVPAVDQAEPAKPEGPGDRPTDPVEAQAYFARLDEYQAAIDAWQDEFKAWQEPRTKAIQEAEGLINRFQKDQGYMFNVSVPGHWLKLTGLILGMIITIPFFQRRKDFAG
jgi:ABC-type multidrug transport system ATPase subunit